MIETAAASTRLWPVAVTGLGLTTAVGLLFARSARTKARAVRPVGTDDPLARHHLLSAENERLEQENARLLASNETLRHFVAVVSHEMRTPLTAVRGFSELLLNGWERTPADVRVEYLKTIDRASGRLSRLVDNLLTSSMIESGRVIPRPEETDLARMIRDAASEAGVQPVVDCPPSLAVNADPDHAYRMLINYLNNAEKYGAPPLRVDVRSIDGSAQVRVTDSGMGVPAEFVDRLFEKFARAEPFSTKKGTGLGLSIVRSLARANGGDAWYEQGSPGACFVVTFPLAKDPASESTAPDNVAPESEAI